MDQPPKLNDVPPRLRTFAREQRQTMPRAEALFWSQVRNARFNGHKFKRQVPVTPYIVDFLCAAARLIVELDGAPHETSARREQDAKRDAWLAAQGFRVLRFSNDLVLSNLDVVMNTVGVAIEQRGCPSPASLREAPSPNPSRACPTWAPRGRHRASPKSVGGGLSAPTAQQVTQ